MNQPPTVQPSEQLELIPISFAVTARMQSFIELRDALQCLQQSYETHSPYAWLTAAKELHDMLVGEGSKKPALPNVIALFTVMHKHFTNLAEKHPQFQNKLHQACTDIAHHEQRIRDDAPLAIDFLCNDAWLTTYYNCIRKQDMLGYKHSMPQVIPYLWAGEMKHAHRLHTIITPLSQAMQYLNHMLHAHVPWQPRHAQSGSDQITLNKHDDIGLLIVGLPKIMVQQGVLPSYSGSRQLVRFRFNQWLPGKPVQNVKHDFNYSIMLVPIS